MIEYQQQQQNIAGGYYVLFFKVTHLLKNNDNNIKEYFKKLFFYFVWGVEYDIEYNGFGRCFLIKKMKAGFPFLRSFLI